MILAVGAFWKMFSAILFLLVCFLLIVIVLLQKGRGGGLSGAFGGAGGHSAFGAKTGDFLTWVTVGLAGTFLLIAIINSFAFQKVTVDTGAPPTAAQMPMGGAVAPGGAGAAQTGGTAEQAGESGESKPPPAEQVPAQTTPPEGDESGDGSKK